MLGVRGWVPDQDKIVSTFEKESEFFVLQLDTFPVKCEMVCIVRCLLSVSHVCMAGWLASSLSVHLQCFHRRGNGGLRVSLGISVKSFIL